jgi:outer membrane protein
VARLGGWKTAALGSTLAAFFMQPGTTRANDAAPELLSAAQTGQCNDNSCTVQMTAQQLLGTAEKLVSEHRFDEAAPLLDALAQAPQIALERDFLLGYAAVEQGKTEDAVRIFRKILNKNPEQTRVRLELGRALMLQGKTLNADHHFRLAQQDRDLPDDVAAMVRSTRGVLRTKRNWAFNMDFGFAPDSNITNGTNAETVSVNVGPFELPLQLDESARKKSGTGQFVTSGASARFGFIGESRLLVEGNSQFTNYSGKTFDDFAVELAVGPEVDVSDRTQVSLQALGSQRWYGGRRAATGFGVRAGIQRDLGDVSRLGLTIDARRQESGFSTAYSGWQLGAYASYERVIAQRFIASATLFGRRDALNSKPYASFETGANLGIAGELPMGLNAALSVGASRAWYDGALALFSPDPRKDWRLNARAQIGVRALRIAGFSPSIAYSYSASLSSLTLYDSKRSRFRFALARYF